MKNISENPGRVTNRILLILAVFCLIFALFLRWPGSVPRGWQFGNGNISSTIGRVVNGKQLYYPTVQYLALGYSYEVTSSHGLIYPPAPGSGSYRVAFNPEQPQQAKIVGEVPANYLAVVLPALAILFMITYFRYAFGAAGRKLEQRLEAKLTADTDAELTMPEVPSPEPVEPLTLAVLEPVPPIEEPENEILEQESIVPEPEAVEAEAESPEQTTLSQADNMVSAEPVIIQPETMLETTPKDSQSTKDEDKDNAAQPKPKKTPVKPINFKGRSIYIPKVESDPEPKPAKPRSARELKTQLKTPKAKTNTPRKKAAPKPKKTTTKKTALKKTTAKKPAASAKAKTK